MRRSLTLAAAAAVLLLAPLAIAETVPSTALLHDLTRNGAYVGCHVTTSYFTTYRLSVTEGDEVQLRVEAPVNNTNAHRLEVEGLSAATAVLRAGDGVTLRFTATPAGSHAVLCDGREDDLSGLLIVRPAPAPTKDAPAVAGLAAIAAVAVVALSRARAGR